jgi:hypothetical protein
MSEKAAHTEKDGGSVIQLTWDDAAHQPKHKGTSASTNG